MTHEFTRERPRSWPGLTPAIYRGTVLHRWPGLTRPFIAAPCLYRWQGQARP